MGTYRVDFASLSEDGERFAGINLINVHEPSQCSGENCTIHNPSNHKMVDCPKLWRDDLGVMERLCSHDVGHPDPDDTAHWLRMGVPASIAGTHACCKEHCCGD